MNDVCLEIPHGKFTVITGPSGSGKSSLAVDTLFAEGQRQYVETLSVYARQFLDQIPKPDVDAVTNLQPTLCIDQHRGKSNRRSTVGTLTEIYDYLRVVMARVADIHCHKCGAQIEQLNEDQIIARIESLPEKSKLILLAPIVRGKKGDHHGAFEQIQKAGLVRVRVDGEVFDIDARPVIDSKKQHTIDAVVDRIVVREGIRDRLYESLGLAIKLSGGTIIISYQNEDAEWCDWNFSTKLACSNCNVSYLEIEPRSFSFNSPYGACPNCDGLGVTEQFIWDRVLDRAKSIQDGAIVIWENLAKGARQSRIDKLGPILELIDVDQTIPLAELDAARFEQMIGGNETTLGLSTLLQKELVTTTASKRLEFLETFRSQHACDACKGSRLGEHSNSARLNGKTISELVSVSIDDAKTFFEQLKLDETRQEIGRVALDKIKNRLKYLAQVGLGYLTLARATDSLSGGEYQRVRLATSIGSGLAGVCYVLDEPTIGLHPRDNTRMIESIRGLQNYGNTVVVVEHDEEVMRACDWMIEFGPGAGEHGGDIVAKGSIEDILKNESSTTGNFLSGRRQFEFEIGSGEVKDQPETNLDSPDRNLCIRNANIHCVKNLDLDIPLGQLVAITGVSGSGKSSLVDFVIAPNLNTLAQTGSIEHPQYCDSFTVPKFVSGLVTVDQSPLGRTSRSNPATYSGMFAEIRKVFAATQLSKQRGYSATRFSFNSPDGRCPECKGHGEIRIGMTFLPEMIKPCLNCQGRRYNQQTLQVRYRDRSIADILEMSVETARDFFANFAKIARILERFEEVGLGYLKLGQSASTLSGGEAQRVKLATELARPSEFVHTIYLLDEPTTGLHFVDVERLLNVLASLVEQGNSVIVIEHHLEIVRRANWIIDLGPEGGDLGGRIVAQGPPKTIVACPESYTGKYLSP